MKVVLLISFLILSNLMTGQNFHSKFEYADSIYAGFSIKNSYPKGGQRYTSLNGQEFTYVVFWTSLENTSLQEFDVKIDFPKETIEIPTAPNIDFTLLLPNEKMSLEKDPLVNYGLDIKRFLDKNLGKPSASSRRISSNDSYLFYTVVLSNRGVDGVIRAGFELQGEDLHYKINGYNFKCGSILLKK